MYQKIITTLIAAAALLFYPLLTQAHFQSDELKQIHIDDYRPSPVPDRIIMTLSGDPATQRAVNWRTNNNSEMPLAQIALADGSPYQQQNAVTLQGQTSELVTEHYISYHHRVRFSALQPASKYIYRVGDGQVWSEWMQFSTAKDQPAPFQFIYFGDAQNDLKSRWSRVIRQAYSDMPKADFILHAGDLVNNPESDQEWGEWFYAAGWINGSIPSIATPGNHEYQGFKLTSKWRPHFTFPENGPDNDQLSETVYYVDYQGVRFISLDSQAMARSPLVKTLQQRVWLENILKNNPNNWTVIFHHHPMRAATQGRTGHMLLNLHFKRLYEKYNVDLVLQGHDHSYARGNDLSGPGRWHSQQSPVYVVSVSGPKMYEGGAKWAEKTARDTQLYQLIKVDGNRIHYQARQADGTPFDAFEIIKDSHGNRQVSEL